MTAATNIRFPDTTSSGTTLYAMSRNGPVLATGIEARWWGDEQAIALHNINSRGETSVSARLVVPVAAIPELIALLEYFYAGPLGRQALARTIPD